MVLDRIVEQAAIFDAWSDEPWVIDGAAVRVSLVCFARMKRRRTSSPGLNGSDVDEINADLTVGSDRSHESAAYQGIGKRRS